MIDKAPQLSGCPHSHSGLIPLLWEQLQQQSQELKEHSFPD